MSLNRDILFTPVPLPHLTLPNRFVRSATYEGLGEPDGAPRAELATLYVRLAAGGVGTIVTGFVFVSRSGRAMQPCQCGLATDAHIASWQAVVQQVRQAAPGVRLIMQLAHAGRQTRAEATGAAVCGVTVRRCTYFRQRVQVLDEGAIEQVIGEFAAAARRARQAGFDGVQVHAAHGYLVHQFLSPWTNRRADRWADRPLFLEEVIRAIRGECGAGFPLLVKLSAAEDTTPGIRLADTVNTVRRLTPLGVDAVEVSYGTMEYPLNIIRGACPVDLVLRVNPLFNRVPRVFRQLWKILCGRRYVAKFIPFREDYNLPAASEIRKATSAPVFAVGGIRALTSMVGAVATHGMAAVSLCRPLICEPDLVARLHDGRAERSACTNCNLCTVYCDARDPVRCYRRRPTHTQGE